MPSDNLKTCSTLNPENTICVSSADTYPPKSDLFSIGSVQKKDTQMVPIQAIFEARKKQERS